MADYIFNENAVCENPTEEVIEAKCGSVQLSLAEHDGKWFFGLSFFGKNEGLGYGVIDDGFGYDTLEQCKNAGYSEAVERITKLNVDGTYNVLIEKFNKQCKTDKQEQYEFNFNSK